MVILGHEISDKHEDNIFLYAMFRALKLGDVGTRTASSWYLTQQEVERQFVAFVDMPFVSDAILERTLSEFKKLAIGERICRVTDIIFDWTPGIAIAIVTLLVYVSATDLHEGLVALIVASGVLIVVVALLLKLSADNTHLGSEVDDATGTRKLHLYSVLTLGVTLLTDTINGEPHIEELIAKYQEEDRKNVVTDAVEIFRDIVGDYVGDFGRDFISDLTEFGDTVGDVAKDFKNASKRHLKTVLEELLTHL